MKKFLTVLCAVVMTVGLCLGICACNKGGDGYTVYAPDGAPALALAKVCADDNSGYDVRIVKADTITAYVTGENPQADFAIIPVNAAVKLLGGGENYKMLGTVTHGNLYLLKKTGGEDITADNLSSLTGKTVGIINLANVPGLMFKVILQQYNIEYNQLTDGAEPVADKVNLKAISAATEVVPTNSECDYFIVAEPIATTKVNATGGQLSVAASLQTLYGGEGGYPQAVAVAKSSVIANDPEAAESFIAALEANQSWINAETTAAETILSALSSHMDGDLASQFTADNLNKTVIANSSISFVSNAEGKQSVLDIMQKLNAVSAQSWGTPSDAFFYGLS